MDAASPQFRVLPPIFYPQYTIYSHCHVPSDITESLHMEQRYQILCFNLISASTVLSCVTKKGKHFQAL
jgi:hypothetical protein